SHISAAYGLLKLGDSVPQDIRKLAQKTLLSYVSPLSLQKDESSRNLAEKFLQILDLEILFPQPFLTQWKRIWNVRLPQTVERLKILLQNSSF
ncbi:MAG: hypothetical protein D6785_15215, partial [Planctomycetota bacterium]